MLSCSGTGRPHAPGACGPCLLSPLPCGLRFMTVSKAIPVSARRTLLTGLRPSGSPWARGGAEEGERRLTEGSAGHRSPGRSRGMLGRQEPRAGVLTLSRSGRSVRGAGGTARGGRSPSVTSHCSGDRQSSCPQPTRMAACDLLPEPPRSPSLGPRALSVPAALTDRLRASGFPNPRPPPGLPGADSSASLFPALTPARVSTPRPHPRAPHSSGLLGHCVPSPPHLPQRLSPLCPRPPPVSHLSLL